MLERPLVDAAAHGGIARGSRSINSTRCPASASAAARFTRVKWSANPTFWLAMQDSGHSVCPLQIVQALHPQPLMPQRRITSRCRAASRSGTVSSTARSSSKPWGSRASSCR